MTSFCFAEYIRLVCASVIVIFSLFGARLMRGQEHTLPFIEACDRDDRESVVAILKQRPTFVLGSFDNRSVLRHAVGRGAHDVAQLLLERRKYLYGEGRVEDLALHSAVRIGRPDMVALLLSYSADVAAVNHFEETPLHYAVESFDSGMCSSNVGITRMLIEHKAPVNATNNQGYTSLHRAAMQSDGLMVAQLLVSRADVAAKNNVGLTPLQSFFYRGNLNSEITRLLVTAGADTSHDCTNACMICDHVATVKPQRDVDVATMALFGKQVRGSLKALPPGVQNMVCDYYSPQDYIVDAIIAERRVAPPRNALVQDDVDELFNACENNDTEKARGLLKKSPALVYATECNKTVLMTAAENNAVEIVKLLLDNRADVDGHSNLGDTALHLAAAAGHMHVVMALLARGANCNARGGYHMMPLHYAAGNDDHPAKQEHVTIARMLLASKALLEPKNPLDSTPLHYAASHAHAPMAAFLLSQGADQWAKNDMRDFPAALVARKHIRQHPLLAKLFMVAGSEVVSNREHTIECRNGEPVRCKRCIEDGIITSTKAEIQTDLTDKHGELVTRLSSYLAAHLYMMPQPLRGIIAEYYTVEQLLLPHVTNQIRMQQLVRSEASSSHRKRKKQQ